MVAGRNNEPFLIEQFNSNGACSIAGLWAARVCAHIRRTQLDYRHFRRHREHPLRRRRPDPSPGLLPSLSLPNAHRLGVRQASRSIALCVLVLCRQNCRRLAISFRQRALLVWVERAASLVESYTQLPG